MWPVTDRGEGGPSERHVSAGKGPHPPPDLSATPQLDHPVGDGGQTRLQNLAWSKRSTKLAPEEKHDRI